MMCCFVMVIVPLNLFLMLYSVTTNNLWLSILSQLALILTVYFLYKMEYALLFSVHSFLSFNIHSVIALRDYVHSQFNQHHEHCHQNLKCGVSFDAQSGLYQMIRMTVSEEENRSNSDDEPIEFSLFYRFNESFVAPILCESFDFENAANSNIDAFHLWSRFVSEFMGVLAKFHEIEHVEDAQSMETQKRIQTVHDQRVRRVYESTLKGLRRVLYVFGLSLVVGVPLIINGSHREMDMLPMTVMVEGVLFLVLAVLSGSVCCSLYSKIWRRVRRERDQGDVHRQQLVQVQGGDGVSDHNADIGMEGNGAKEWIKAVISEIDDVCVELNVRYKQQWTFENDTGFFNAPTGDQYTGKITICSVGNQGDMSDRE